MSRIGRAPIAIPAGVTVTVSDDNIVTVLKNGHILADLLQTAKEHYSQG